VLAEVERFFIPRVEKGVQFETELDAESDDTVQVFPDAALVCD